MATERSDIYYLAEILFLNSPKKKIASIKIRYLHGLWHGRSDRRNIKLCRGTQGPQNRALRHFQGVEVRSCRKESSRTKT